MRRFVNAIMATGLIVMLGAGCVQSAQAPSATPAPVATKAGATAVPDWQRRWDDTVAAAKKEGRVRIYAEAGPELVAAITNGFKDKFGIQVEFVVGKAPNLAEKFLSERVAKLDLADAFFFGGGTLLSTIKPKNVLMDPKPLIFLPEALDAKAWPSGAVPFLDKDKMLVPLTGAYRTFVIINTDLVKKGDVISYRDLADPKWKGKMVMFDPTISGSSSTWVAFILAKIYGMDEGQKYLKQVAAQELAMLKDPLLQVDWVARGKYAMGIGADVQSGSQFFKAGAPIAWANFSEGGLVHPSASVVALPDKPENPNAATLLINWLLTKDGQTAFSQGYGNPAARLGVTTQGLDPFVIPPVGGKLYWNDEDLVRLQTTTAIEVSKTIFGALMK